MTLKENEHRAKQWIFTIPSFDNGTIKRLSNLPAKDVRYCAFAIVIDDTGNRCIEGFVKAVVRRRVASLVRLIGYGFYNVCSTEALMNTLIELKQSPSFSEFGDTSSAKTQGSRKDLASFKLAVDAGVTADQLSVIYPQICSLYPGFVNTCLNKAVRVKTLT